MDWLKIDIDASFLKEDGRSYDGIIARTHEGKGVTGMGVLLGRGCVA